MDYSNMYQNQFNPYAPSMPYLAQAQPARSAANNVSWVYVNGFDGARSQIVQPGQTAWMMDNNDSVIYVKAVDSMGTATLKGFRLTEISDKNDHDKSSDNYVSKSDFESIEKRLSAIEKELGGINT